MNLLLKLKAFPAKKRKQSSTDDVTNSTPQKRNKTNPDRLTIYLRDENYINDKNTIKNILAQIKISFPNEKLLAQKIDCVLTKVDSILEPIEKARAKNIDKI